MNNNSNFILRTGNNYDEEENDANIFKSKPKQNSNFDLLNPIKIDVVDKKNYNINYASNSNNEKIQNNKKILENQKEKMGTNINSFGMTSNIGFLNMSKNSSIGKNSLLNSLKMTMKPTNENEESKEENEYENKDFSNKKKSSYMNEKFVERLQNKGSINPDDIEELPTISLEKPKPKQNQIENIQIKNVVDVDKDEKEDIEKKKVLKELEDLEISKNKPKEEEIPKKVENEIQTKKHLIDENDPKTKLYNLIMSKDEIDKVNLKYFLYT